MTRIVKVAVVGSGLAGLTAAYLLSSEALESDLFEVHIFEKAKTLGMDASSISVVSKESNNKNFDWRIDVPMRSFQGGYYPQLLAFYKHLGVKFRQADFSYSFSLLTSNSAVKGPRIATTAIYNGQSGRAGVSMPSTFTHTILDSSKSGSLLGKVARYTMIYSSFAVTATYLLLNYIRLLALSIPCFRSPRISEMTFREWADDATPAGFISRFLGLDATWKAFSYDILVPLFSAVCTAPANDVLQHPAEEFLDYVWLTLFTHHYVAADGVRDVVARLSRNIQHIHVDTLISAFQPDQQDSQLVSVTCMESGSEKVYSGFHHIIFATQANAAAPLLTTYLNALSPDSLQRPTINEQISSLMKFQYRPSIVLNHTDDTLLPAVVQDRRDLNMVSFPSGIAQLSSDSPHCVLPSYTMTTHILTAPCALASSFPAIYQTTNPIVAPREEHILSHARIDRAILTMDAKDALQGFCVMDTPRWWQSRVQCRSGLGLLQGNIVSSGKEAPGIWVCGSYAYHGIPLLEGCVVSARNVVEQGILAREGITVRHRW